jgi:GTP-binding protein HflX
MEGVRRHRALQRENRQRTPLPVIALVGYTNAGKSTLLNKVHASPAGAVYADDKLFATLDPTTRRVRLPSGRWVLFADTVGFIQRLPHHLVAAFRATLEEAAEADLLVHVLDASDPAWKDHERVVADVLSGLGAERVPRLTVFNKADRLETASRLRGERAGRLMVSALTGKGLEALLSAVESRLEGRWTERSFLLPHERRNLLPALYRTGRVLSEKPKPGGAWVTVKLDEKNWGHIQKELGENK